jgi:hypothetical protein
MTTVDDDQAAADQARRGRAQQRRAARSPQLGIDTVTRLICARSYEPATAPPGQADPDRAAGYWRAARFRWMRASLDPKCGFAATCGLANMLATQAGKGTEPGHMKVYVVDTNPDAHDARERDLVSALAAFVAAIGNDDYRGALEVWTQLDIRNMVDLGWRLAVMNAVVAYDSRPGADGHDHPGAN